MKFWALVLVIFASALLIGLVILEAHPDLTWHDQQRIGQIAISSLAMLGMFFLGVPNSYKVNSSWFWSSLVILFFGLFSTLNSSHLFWASVEFSLLLANIGIGVFVFCLFGCFGVKADLVLGGFLRLLLSCMVFQFYISVISAAAHADLFFTPWSLLYGFSNVRFEGQFLTLVTPILAARLCIREEGGGRYPRWFDVFLMVSLAAMVFVAGTRGTIAAWLTISTLFLTFKGDAKFVAKRMLLVLGLGFVLGWLILTTLGWLTGQVSDYRFASDHVFGLSAREILWNHAWELILGSPWLGWGPMHFASVGNHVATHPHQALLQIASEWGLPLLSAVCYVVVIWVNRVFSGARSVEAHTSATLQWALVFASMSSLMQSMVDGVLVMPYPQLWLAIVVAWCSSRCLPAIQGREVRIPAWIPMILWGGSNALLIAVSVMSYPILVEGAGYCRGGPRFWCAGQI